MNFVLQLLCWWFRISAVQAGAFAAAPSLDPIRTSDVFNVRAFGARGDGVSLDTTAVRAAAEAISENGGGILLFPFSPSGGSTYLTGSFNLSSHCTLRIEPRATVLGAVEGSEWPLVEVAPLWPQWRRAADCNPAVAKDCSRMHQSLVFAWNSEDITIEGGGTLDCNARFDTWWQCALVPGLEGAPCDGYGRPHCLFVSNSSKVVMRDITVQNSPFWTLHFTSVTGLRVRNITVLNPAHAPNADGIDVDCSQDVVVEDSYFSVGDDALCVKSGEDYWGRVYGRPSRDIIFRRNVIGTGHGITIGSETSGGVFNVTFEDIVMNGTEIGLRLKTQRGRGGVSSDITWRNITMFNIELRCVEFSMNYHVANETNATATPLVRNLLLENIYCEGANSSASPNGTRNSFNIDGIPESPIQNLQIRNFTIAGEVGPELFCTDVDCSCDAATSPCPSCCRNTSTPSQVVI